MSLQQNQPFKREKGTTPQISMPLSISEQAEELLLLLAHCEASHHDRVNPTQPLRKNPEFLTNSKTCWKLVEESCGTLSRIQHEIATQLTEVHQGLKRDIGAILLEEILSLYTNPTQQDRTNLLQELELCDTGEDLNRVYKKHMGNWPVEQFFDDLSPFNCLATIELTKASVDALGSKVQSNPNTANLFDFLAVEMFARFDVALTDVGLTLRSSFFTGESPKALLQQQRLQCVLSFLVKVGFISDADRKWIRTLEPALFEGEICRAFCLFIKDHGGIPVNY